MDILLTGTPGKSGESVTTTILENVVVLTTGHRLQVNANGQPENVPVVNLLLTPEDSELITLATSEGRLQFVLRNPMDDEKTAAKRRPARRADLFRKGPQRDPAPRVRRALPPPPPSPPRVVRIEMIRGNRRSMERIASATN